MFCLRCFNINIVLDQEAVAKLAEVDMIIADLERANSRIVTLEHRNVTEFHWICLFKSFIVCG